MQAQFLFNIDSISCNHKFSGKEIFNGDLGEDIFARLSGTIISPGYAIRCPLVGYGTTKDDLHFHAKYHSSIKTFEDTFTFNIRANSPFADTYPSEKNTDDHLKNISSFSSSGCLVFNFCGNFLSCFNYVTKSNLSRYF